MKIFIVGSGKLANAILSSYLSFPSSELMKWESPDKTQDEKAIVVYAGSGRQLKECIEFCERTGSVFEDAFDMSCHSIKTVPRIREISRLAYKYNKDFFSFGH